MSDTKVNVKIKTEFVEDVSYKTEYSSQLQADRIADNIESVLGNSEELWLDDWTDVEKSGFGTMLVRTQDPNGTQHVFEVAVNELDVDVQELDPEDEPEAVDPDARRDMDQDR